MKMHNGAGNGQGRMFITHDTMELDSETGATMLMSVMDTPKGLETCRTKWNFKDRLCIDEMEAVVQRSLYRGVSKLRQHAYARKNYKSKNENGGIKCRMTTPADYRNRPDTCCIAWGTLREGMPVYEPPISKGI